MIYHPRLVCRCDECKTEAGYDNPQNHADYLLERKAVEAGWFLAHTGKDLCPKCSAAMANRLGLPSLWDVPRPAGVQHGNINPLLRSPSDQVPVVSKPTKKPKKAG